MILFRITLFFALALFFKVDASDFKFANELRDSEFCSICIPKKLDEKTLREYDIQNTEDITFCSLLPIEIFWGSYTKAELSLKLHPVYSDKLSQEIMVVIRDENKVLPGEWIKTYIPIETKKTTPKIYLLSGDKMIDRKLLFHALREQSALMRKSFPLDRVSPK